jgi:hypothetical protein
MHLYFQNGFFVGFFAFFHLKTELNNFFSSKKISALQIALFTKTPYALVIQVSKKLNKISDLMHLYYQSGFLAGFFAFFSSKNIVI